MKNLPPPVFTKGHDMTGNCLNYLNDFLEGVYV